MVADLIKGRIRAIGSRWRKLPPGRQAVIVLAVLRHGQRLADMAGGNGLSPPTVRRWLLELTTYCGGRGGAAGNKEASPATAWRVLDGIDAGALSRLRAARAAAREVTWAQHAETRGTFPQARATARVIPNRFDIDSPVTRSSVLMAIWSTNHLPETSRHIDHRHTGSHIRGKQLI